jgi:hypothetical protein
VIFLINLIFVFLLIDLDLIFINWLHWDFSSLILNWAFLSHFTLINLRQIHILCRSGSFCLSLGSGLFGCQRSLFLFDLLLSFYHALSILAILPPDREVPNTKLLRHVGNKEVSNNHKADPESELLGHIFFLEFEELNCPASPRLIFRRDHQENVENYH